VRIEEELEKREMDMADNTLPETGIPGKRLPSNPTPLSAPQEQQVRDLYYKNVRAKCAEEIKGRHWQFLHDREGEY
jgi:hypothetical protein